MSNPAWACRLDLSDVFHNDGYTFEEKRDIIVQRLKALPSNDVQLRAIVARLSKAFDTDSFDTQWNTLYDWADSGKRLWIRTI